MKLAGLLFLLFLPFQVVAQESDFRPASFSDSPDSLQNLIVFPIGINEDIDITIPCQAYVSRWGEINRLGCLNLDMAENYPQLRQTIQNVQQEASIEPAWIDGRRTSVVFQFTVRFLKSGNLESIEVFPNYGFNVERLGLDYTAPQVILSNGSNNFSLRRRAGDSTSATCPVGTKFIVAVSVGVDGVPMAVSFGDTDNFPSSCERETRNSFGSLSFIPAFKDGQPVEAMFVDFFGRDPVEN